MTFKLSYQHFTYCPRCGKTGIGPTPTPEKEVQCPHCDFTMYFNPVASAAAMIFDETGRLLVIERAREPRAGTYGLPGGFADIGERLEEVVAREVKEEVNLDISGYTFYASYPNEYPYKDILYPVMDTYFKATVHDFSILSAEESEVSSMSFVDPATVPEDKWCFPSLQAVIKQYLSEKRSAEDRPKRSDDRSQ